MTDQSTTSSLGNFGKRLPPGAAFVTVSQLYALSEEEREEWELWVSGGASAWMPVARLLRQPHYSESHLASTPSGLMLVARRIEP